MPSFEELLDVLPVRILKWGCSEAPAIAIESEVVDDPESADDSQEVASEDVDDHMIPPAFFEVVEYISK